nr:cell wall protein [Streptomyces graminofaciens]
MFMRLCTFLTLVLPSAAALSGGPTAAALPVGCGGSAGPDFPIQTRIHGGPATYDAGGGYRNWSLDLTNTTRRSCGNIHPVVVLVDDKRALEPGQPKLEFYDGRENAPYPVTFERTDADELVGVFGGPGLTVPPGRTLTVRVRLSLTSDALAPNDVVANAAVVERRGDDGEWVGESNDYRFRIVDSDSDSGSDGDGDGDEDSGRDSGRDSGSGSGRDGDSHSHSDDGGGGSRLEGGTGGETGRGGTDGLPQRATPYADELARTGRRHQATARYAATAGLSLLAMGGLLLAIRRPAARRLRGTHR